jgi:hypothetical protein
MGAIISVCGRYRYSLTRTLDDANQRSILWVMLNPSTADASTDDRTIGRLRGFSQRWGFGAFTVVNLYALRSPNPADLWAADDPIGPDNDSHIERAAMNHETCVVAWGGNAESEHAAAVHSVLARFHDHVMCLGVVASGAPKHPLYVHSETELQPWVP